MMFRYLLIGLCLFFYSTVTAPINADQALIEDFIALAIGEYDSRAQMAEDIENNVPEANRHFRVVVRTYGQVEAPALGPAILLSTVEYNFGGKWAFDQNEFLIWTLTLDESGKKFEMSPRRFKNQIDKLPFARQPQKLAGISSADLQPAISGSNCVLVWERTKEGFEGRSEPCAVMSTTKGKVLNWEWHYKLNDKALTIAFDGRDENGVSLDGTEKTGPYRLDRSR